METLRNCPLCMSDNTKFLFNSKDFSSNKEEIFSMSKCLKCGVIFLSQRPKEDEISNYYFNDYKPYLGDYNYLVKKIIKKRTLKEIKLFNKLNNSIQDVLEIGCSYGKYLNNLKKYGGYRVTGVEIDEDSCLRGQKEYGIKIKNNILTNVEFPANRFDLIIMNHLIEHLYNPEETIKEVFKILRPGGLIIIKTPNFKTLERKIFKKYWGPYEAPRHLFIFSEKILKKLLNQSGFKTFNVFYEKTPNNIILSLKNYLSQKQRGKKISELFNVNNYFLLALLLPFSFLLGKFKQSGRMVIIAKKPTSVYGDKPKNI